MHDAWLAASAAGSSAPCDAIDEGWCMMNTIPAEKSERRDDVREIAAQLRIDSIRSSTQAGSGHPTSSLSAADLMAVLLRDFLHWDLEHPDDPRNDHLIFSKGHASPLLYAMLKAKGAISDADLLTFRRFGSRLQGHPAPTLPGIDVASGSLGQGLPVGVGLALCAKRVERLPYRVWVLIGDSEMSEGSIWEAFDHARYYGLDNLVAILDMNRLGQRGETPLGANASAYVTRARAFGWRAIAIDGHSPSEIAAAYSEAVRGDAAPMLIVAQTIKGKGVSFIEDKNGWHGKTLDAAQAAKAIAELGGARSKIVEEQPPAAPARTSGTIPVAAPRSRTDNYELPRYERATAAATRKAYGDALVAIGAARPDVVVLDAEVSNSTFAELFAKAYPDRYFEMFIAEQQLVAAGVAMSVRRRTPFLSTFAAFLTRAHDFIRMAAISRANIRLCGSHAGVSIGEDGPSQMGLEDLAMMRAIYGSTVLYPSCANQTAKLTAAMADQPGVVYLRTTREKTAVLYPPTESFPIGGSKTLRSSPDDRITVIAAGITVHEALKAYERLSREELEIRVIDAYSIKPIDAEAIREAVQETDGDAIVVEDHWAQGGLGDAVLECLAGEEPIAARVVRLAVTEMPGSGTPAELLHAARIDADAIVAEARRIAGR
jgi:transketolase